MKKRLHGTREPTQSSQNILQTNYGYSLTIVTTNKRKQQGGNEIE